MCARVHAYMSLLQMKLIETLLIAEGFAQFQSPVNCYRKLLGKSILYFTQSCPSDEKNEYINTVEHSQRHKMCLNNSTMYTVSLYYHDLLEFLL